MRLHFISPIHFRVKFKGDLNTLIWIQTIKHQNGDPLKVADERGGALIINK